MRRGFTMVELLMAGVLLAVVLASMGVAMRQVVSARSASVARTDAFVRADAALRMIRRDLSSILRRTDLYFTRLVIFDSSPTIDGEVRDRDDLLLFNNRLVATRDIEYNGDGLEFETQYRLEDDEAGTVLWERRDPMPDDYPTGGGIITPRVEGVVSLNVEAWNGHSWLDEWDSDDTGLPWALRVTVTATGAGQWEDTIDRPTAMLRTVVPIDRSRMPLETADARLANDLIEKWALDPELHDRIIEALENETVPPLQLASAETPDGAGPGAGGAVPGLSGGGGRGGSVTIDTPDGTVTIPGDGGKPSFSPGGGAGRGGPSGGGGGGPK